MFEPLLRVVYCFVRLKYTYHKSIKTQLTLLSQWHLIIGFLNLPLYNYKTMHYNKTPLKAMNWNCLFLIKINSEMGLGFWGCLSQIGFLGLGFSFDWVWACGEAPSGFFGWGLMWSQLSQCSQLSQSTTTVVTPTTIVAKNHNCRNANHNCRNSAQPQLSQRQSQMSQFFRNFIFSFLISILYNYGILSHLLWSLHHFLLYSQ